MNNEYQLGETARLQGGGTCLLINDPIMGDMVYYQTGKTGIGIKGDLKGIECREFACTSTSQAGITIETRAWLYTTGKILVD